MGKQVQIEGADTSTLDALLGVVRQILVDTSRNDLRVMDGVQPGGFRIPNVDAVAQMIATAIGENIIAIRFYADSTELASAPVAENVLAVIKQDEKDAFYIWKNEANPNDGTAITSLVAGIWRKTGNIGTISPSYEITNFNDVHESGIYLADSSSASNAPAAGGQGILIHTQELNFNSGVGLGGAWAQIFISMQQEGVLANIPYISTRVYQSGTGWFSWTTVNLLYGATPGNRGSYVFARNNTTAVAMGATVAGSNLKPTDTADDNTASNLSGTWVAQGKGSANLGTLYKRTL